MKIDKPYWVFYFSNEPGGGMNDFSSDYETLEEALAELKKLCSEHNAIGNVVNIETKEIFLLDPQ